MKTLTLDGVTPWGNTPIVTTDLVQPVVAELKTPGNDTPLGTMLVAARLDLLNASTSLALIRKHPTAPAEAREYGERRVCAALDRVWALQCMIDSALR